jgi:hypothetical protein
MFPLHSYPQGILDLPYPFARGRGMIAPEVGDVLHSKPHPVWDSRRLWSLADMIEFLGFMFLAGFDNLTTYEQAIFEAGITHGPTAALDNITKQMLLSAVNIMEPECRRIGITISANRLATMRSRVNGEPRSGQCNLQIIQNEISIIRKTVKEELTQQKFAYIPDGNQQLFEQTALFGESVSKAFPSAADDLKNAGNCIATGMNTAGVFHLVRAAELALGVLARHLKITEVKNRPVRWATWGAVINSLRDKLQQTEQMARGQTKDNDLEFCTSILDNFKAIQHLYRDRTMHLRKTYDDGEVRTALLRVRSVMNLLASRGISEEAS